MHYSSKFPWRYSHSGHRPLIPAFPIVPSLGIWSYFSLLISLHLAGLCRLWLMWVLFPQDPNLVFYRDNPPCHSLHPSLLISPGGRSSLRVVLFLAAPEGLASGSVSLLRSPLLQAPVSFDWECQMPHFPWRFPFKWPTASFGPIGTGSCIPRTAGSCVPLDTGVALHIQTQLGEFPYPQGCYHGSMAGTGTLSLPQSVIQKGWAHLE